MKKNLLKVFAAAGIAFTLASCGSVSSSYADKVNKAAATEKTTDDLTYTQVLKDLGDPQINLTVNLLGGGESGACTWYKGYKTADEASQAYDAGKTVKSITITFAGGKATKASYSEDKKDSEKK